jgi:hypothetical protein
MEFDQPNGFGWVWIDPDCHLDLAPLQSATSGVNIKDYSCAVGVGTYFLNGLASSN